MSQLPQPSDEHLDDQGISLEELSQAYADAMDGGPADAAAAEARSQPETAAGTEPTPEDLDVPLPEECEVDDDPCPISPAAILEAALFVGNRQGEPLSPARAADLMRGVEPHEIPQLVAGLNGGYVQNGCPYRVAGEGSGYRLVLDRAFDPVRNKLYGRVREAHLSQAAVDVLAIVAYRQPLTGEEVGKLRGTPSGHVLAQLVRRCLLVMERPEGKRKPAQYRTTDRFLKLFGLDSLDDLPQAEDPEPR